MKLNFFEWNQTGSPDPACPLVFLHGMGGTGQMWRPIVANLEDQVACFAPDQRGHGQSRPIPETPPRFRAQDYAADLIETLDELGIKNCILIGHSMGVRTALATAVKIPERIRALIAVDIGITSVWGGGMGPKLALFLSALPESFVSREELKTYCFAHCPDPAIAQYLSAVAKKENENAWIFPFDHSALVQTIEAADQAPIENWVKNISQNRIPTWFLRGERSLVWSFADYEKQKAEFASPTLHFENWENCGHGLPFEQRKRFVEKVREIYIACHGQA